MTSITLTRPAAASSGLARTARALLFLMGVFQIVATTVFTFFTPEGAAGVENAFDVLVSAWSYGIGTALLVSAVRAGARPFWWNVAIGTYVVHFIFSVVKTFVYDENVWVLFLVDLAMLGLLTVVRRRG